MQSDMNQNAQALLAQWQRKTEALRSLCTMTEQMTVSIEHDEADFDESVRIRDEAMALVDGMDKQAAELLSLLSSTQNSLSADIDARMRAALEQEKAQIRDALAELKELDGRLQNCIRNRMAEMSQELRETKDQIRLNSEYRSVGDDVQATFDTRL